MKATEKYLEYLERINTMSKEEFQSYLSSIVTIKNLPAKRLRITVGTSAWWK